VPTQRLTFAVADSDPWQPAAGDGPAGSALEDVASRERQLWCAVILHTLYEAAGRVAYSENGERERVQRDAIAWFENAGADFQDVCCLADLPPEVVREAALRVIRSQRLPRVRIPKAAKRPPR